MSSTNSSSSPSEQPPRPHKGEKGFDRLHRSVETLWETVWECQQLTVGCMDQLKAQIDELRFVCGHQHDEIQRLKASLPPPRFRRRP